jgi:hypothetical protein
MPFHLPSSYKKLSVEWEDSDLPDLDAYILWLDKELTTAKAYRAVMQRELKATAPKKAKPKPEKGQQ